MHICAAVNASGWPACPMTRFDAANASPLGFTQRMSPTSDGFFHKHNMMLIRCTSVNSIVSVAASKFPCFNCGIHLHCITKHDASIPALLLRTYEAKCFYCVSSFLCPTSSSVALFAATLPVDAASKRPLSKGCLTCQSS